MIAIVRIALQRPYTFIVLALLILLFVGLGGLAYLWLHPAVRVRFAPGQRPPASSSSVSSAADSSFGNGPPPPGVPLYGAAPDDDQSNPNSSSS